MNGNEIINNINSDIRAKMPDIEQVRMNCLNQIAGKVKKTHKLRNVLVAVLCTVMSLFLMSAVIYIPGISNITRSLIFKGFEVNQVGTLGYGSSDRREGSSVVASSWTFDIKDPAVEQHQNLNYPLEQVYFDTIEEAGRHLAFIPSGFGYIPENYEFYGISLFGDSQGKYDKNSCLVHYKMYLSSSHGKDFYRDLVIRAQYVGKNATMKINTIHDIEKITFNNGIDALLMTVSDEFYTIAWIKDDAGYSFSGVFDRDEVIKLAESVE